MRIDKNILSNCFASVRNITDQYKLHVPHGNDVCRSVDDLKRVCEIFLDSKIKILKLNRSQNDSVVFGSYIAQSDGTRNIIIVKDLNYCWQRFVVCKELFHAVMDADEYRDMDIVGHVQALTLAFPDDDSKPRPSVTAEFMAEVAAMEFLFPMERRLIEQKNTGLSIIGVAQRYKIPQKFVERYLSGQFMDNLSDPEYYSGTQM
jgi:Zn-dependent peptidase ImmA (M78 family)